MKKLTIVQKADKAIKNKPKDICICCNIKIKKGENRTYNIYYKENTIEAVCDKCYSEIEWKKDKFGNDYCKLKKYVAK